KFKTMSVNDVLKGMGYKFIAEIGEGSFSQVKLATSQKHHCNVAIKIVDRVKAPKDFVQKFLPRELVILRRVNHDHIVQMHELIEVAGKRLCIVMEAAAKDLLQKIHEVNRIPEDQSKNLFSQMVSAINYLHQMDIVHRDLKCENILLTAEEQVKITDFGFAHCVQDPSELSHTFCGSAAYTPPEVIMGMPYDPKYDVWSLGSLVYPDGAGVQEPCRVFIRTLLQFSPSTRPTIQQVAEHPDLKWGKKIQMHSCCSKPI
uniref:non-specific serine/threonine protein kinase n=1 Tax=Sinocyclocheilus anshuiensis TaxID=1608454 RepID=A0A671SJC9_9TELE